MKKFLLSSVTAGALAIMGYAGLSDHQGYAPAKRVGPKKETGWGAARARARLNAKLKANDAIPSGDRVTRQRIRQAQRAEAKKQRITPAEFGRRRMAVIRGQVAA